MEQLWDSKIESIIRKGDNGKWTKDMVWVVHSSEWRRIMSFCIVIRKRTLSHIQSTRDYKFNFIIINLDEPISMLNKSKFIRCWNWNALYLHNIVTGYWASCNIMDSLWLSSFCTTALHYRCKIACRFEFY